MNKKVRKVLMTFGFGLAQILGIVLIILALYAIGHTPFALDIAEVDMPATKIAYFGAGTFVVMITAFALFILTVVGYGLYKWGKFTRKKAAKWNTKLNIKLTNWENSRRIRKASLPDWEV